MARKFALGDRVVFRSGAVLVRRYERRPFRVNGRPVGDRHNGWKVWKPRWEPNSGLSDTLMEGIVIGQRTMTNGIVKYLGEDGTNYTAIEGFQGLLIATDLRSAHVKVRADDVMRKENEVG